MVFLALLLDSASLLSAFPTELAYPVIVN